MEKPKKRLLVLVREAIRRKHYSRRTEEAYIYWIKRYIFFHNKRHPLEMGNGEVEAFLTDLATKRLVSASTQNQAFSALLFLYREVLNKPLEGPINSLRAKRPKKLPTVLTREETLRVIERISGVHQLMAKLLYGSGLRLSECVELRVKDIDFTQRQIIVRDAKGMQDRVTILPEGTIKPLREQLERVRKLHQGDLRIGGGSVYLPFALARKYPSASREWG